MHFVASIILFSAGFVMFAKACEPGMLCTNRRGTILQVDADISRKERSQRLNRMWFISSTTLPFNAILAFKDFSSNFTSAIVVSYNNHGQPTSHHYTGNLRNFELILENTNLVIVYIPIGDRKTAEFTLHYITGCSILSSAQGVIDQDEPGVTSQSNQNCWLIHPSGNSKRNRIYFNVHKISLSEDRKLNIKDLHTSNNIFQTSNESEMVFAAESQENRHQQSILVDVQCTGSNCNTDALNTFSLQYHTMTSRDNNCIQRSQSCYANTNISEVNCQVVCPALTDMILDEYRTHGKEEDLNTAVIRSGTIRCPFPPKYCGCPKIFPKTIFCNPKIKCKKLKKCTFACIYHKLTTCVKVTVFDTIMLLG